MLQHLKKWESWFGSKHNGLIHVIVFNFEIVSKNNKEYLMFQKREKLGTRL
jgi:hypothetical protein